MTHAPAFILVEPQLGENIGAVARVMGNFGLTDLRLVAPRDGWPNPAADTMSAGALPDVVTARVFATVEEAVADLGLVLATTARLRGMEKPVLNAATAVERLSANPGASGVLFGAERAGLPNEAVALADAIVTLPVNPGFASLNLSQAAGVIAHAWAAGRPDEMRETPPGVDAPATRFDLIGMMEHFEDELERAGFFHPLVKKPVMIQNLRNAFTRSGWTEQEVRTFRGAIKALARGRGKARVIPPQED
ncbi:MAG: RNA methyltransferase [Hyphomonadaceae bacterium]